MKEKCSGWNKKLLQSMLVASVAVPLHLFAFGAGSAIYAEGQATPPHSLKPKWSTSMQARKFCLTIPRADGRSGRLGY